MGVAVLRLTCEENCCSHVQQHSLRTALVKMTDRYHLVDVNISKCAKVKFGVPHDE